MTISEFYGTEIFLDNNATKEYLDICRASLNRGCGDEYYELHEVIPPDFFRFLNNSGLFYSKAMPKEKRVYCPLTPEEHWRCHQLLVDMFPEKTKQLSLALLGYSRITNTIFNSLSKEDYGTSQRARHGDKWKRYSDEIYKYHPELLDGRP